MRKNRMFFKYEDSEYCYHIVVFVEVMRKSNLTELEVFEAIREIIGGGIFWCKKHEFCGDDSSQSCGRTNCKDYDPRNGISGVCKHHTHWLYSIGDKRILKYNHATKEAYLQD